MMMEAGLDMLGAAGDHSASLKLIGGLNMRYLDMLVRMLKKSFGT